MSFLKDITTLDVITVTGSMRVKTSGDNDAVKDYVIDFDTLFGKDASKKTKIRGDLRVIAATHVEIDRDTMTFVADDLGEKEQKLLAMHMEAVNSASAARAEIVARFLPNPNRDKVGEGNA
jgi:hypothetical protein